MGNLLIPVMIILIALAFIIVTCRASLRRR